MSVHFAAARCTTQSPLARALAKRPVAPAANDNADRNAAIDQSLRDALMHFAEHGLDAANDAARKASDAAGSGSDEEYRHWIGICGKLDGKLADQVAARGKTAEDVLIG
ncbi:hypothetical protein [Qipengyuania xiamenensis]|uniref:hypothetical protein n=1 Tax=Qipengyuania xiamenensis TaxID=2867237 RepID=UPI001FFD04F7|nr:hypothetical protein [Qipengyuania xiamenensis]